MSYSPTELEVLSRQLRTKNRYPIKEASWISLIYLALYPICIVEPNSTLMKIIGDKIVFAYYTFLSN